MSFYTILTSLYTVITCSNVCYADLKNVEVIKRLKPEGPPNELDGLLRPDACTCHGGSVIGILAFSHNPYFDYNYNKIEPDN